MNSTQKNPFLDVYSCSASQAIPCFYYNPKVRYPVHNSPSLYSILSHMNPLHTPIFFTREHNVNIFT
jgi:hypothetical protein